MKTFSKNWSTIFFKSTKIENAAFPYITALSETNVKTNRIVSTKWTYPKEQSFASNYFSFSKVLLQFKNLLLRADLMYKVPKRPHPNFS